MRAPDLTHAAGGEADPPPPPAAPGPAALLPGLVLVGALAVVAIGLGRLVPVIGGPVFAIVGGMLIATFRPPSPQSRPGLGFASKTVLQASIVVLGLNLSVHQVLATGASSLPVLLGTLVTALAVAWWLGRRLGLGRDLNTLIGVGTAICGASAIAATNAVIEADDADVSYAIATIFTFNVVAVLTYPSLGHLLGLSQHAFGLWAGTAINDTSSVVAASTIYGHQAAAYAVVVKLTRTLAIVPICLALAGWRRRRSPATTSGAERLRWRQVLPVFILVFMAAVLANTLGLVPGGAHRGLSDLAGWMITAALGAIGLSSRPRSVRVAGARPLMLGAALWATVGLTSLGLQALTGTF
jgi:uncharacterized integral membrane protein (TIGR00698 family)